MKLAHPDSPEFTSTAPLTSSIVTCVFKGHAYAWPPGKDGDEPTLELAKGERDHAFTIAGLDTDTPTLKANMGEAPLKVVTRTAENLVLVEIADAGFVNTYTLSLTRRVIAISKAVGGEVGPYGMTSVGRCY